MTQSTKQHKCMQCHWLLCILGPPFVFVLSVLSDGILFRIRDTPIQPQNKPSPMLCCRLLTMSWLIDSSTVLKQRYHSDIAVKESLPYLRTLAVGLQYAGLCEVLVSNSDVSRASLIDCAKAYTHTHWPVHCPDHRHSNNESRKKLSQKIDAIRFRIIPFASELS